MLRIIWLIMLISGLLILIISIVLMAVFRIFHLMGELTGSNARRQVEKLKQMNLTTTTTSNLIINSETADEEEIPIKDFDLSNIKPKELVQNKEEQEVIEDDVGKTSYMETSDSTSYMDVSNSTTYMDEDNRTTFMDDLEDLESTSFIEEAIKESENHTVILVMEQTSLEIA